jgi:hypothetical protein
MLKPMSTNFPAGDPYLLLMPIQHHSALSFPEVSVETFMAVMAEQRVGEPHLWEEIDSSAHRTPPELVYSQLAFHLSVDHPTLEVMLLITKLAAKNSVQTTWILLLAKLLRIFHPTTVVHRSISNKNFNQTWSMTLKCSFYNPFARLVVSNLVKFTKTKSRKKRQKMNLSNHLQLWQSLPPTHLRNPVPILISKNQFQRNHQIKRF